MSLQLSAESKARIEAITGRYPNRQAALLPSLHIAQHQFGHLSPEVQSLVATALGVPTTLVREVVTFYEMFHEHPEGQFHLEICTAFSCHLMGADALTKHCKKRLGVEVGHHTADGMFSLMEAECLASCGSGPVMKVGEDYYEHLTPEALDALLEELKKQAPALAGKHYEHAKGGPHVGPVKGFAPKLLPITPMPAAPTKKDSEAPAAPASTTAPKAT